MTAKQLARTTFSTSRLLDFASVKELTAQTGHEDGEWPLVIVKELLDNALDACEEAGIAPVITIEVNDGGIPVRDNGPGIPASTVESVLDFAIRVSSREAYVSPTRGAQGNALKTIVAMPFVLDGERGQVEIAARGERHLIAFRSIGSAKCRWSIIRCYRPIVRLEPRSASAGPIVLAQS